MRKHIITLVRLGSLVAVLEMSTPAQAEMGRNSIGPSISTGGGSSVTVGIDSKFGISDNISVRPFVYFPSGGINIGSALTYDFHIMTKDGLPISPFIGGSISATTGGNNSNTAFGLTGGADFPISDSFGLKAALNIPLTSGSSQKGGINIGAGFSF